MDRALVTTSYDVVRTALAATEADVEEHRAEGWAAIDVAGDNGEWMLVAQVDDASSAVVVYAIARTLVPASRRADVAMLLTRVNHGLRLGNFELDLDDGELRFKASVPLPGSPLAPDVADALLMIASSAIDHHLPAIEAVIDGLDPSLRD